MTSDWWLDIGYERIRQIDDRVGSGPCGSRGSDGGGGEGSSSAGATARGHCLSGEEYDGLFSVGDFDFIERDFDGGALFGGAVSAVTG